MSSNRRWLALAYVVFAVLVWVLTSKLLLTVMEWVGVEAYDFALIGERFTLTTLLGLAVATSLGIWAYRHPKLTELSNEVVVELRKVTWPTAAETKAATVVVIITVFIMSFFLGIFDLIWSNFMNFIYPSAQV
jgi:preprotein translocase SecE subunit